jgi:SWI/SNF-related matrix-associated actin-dependent regulator 1 of chromatin subfamily A
MASKLIKTIVNQIDPNIIILDEAHYIKNPEAKRTKELLPFIRNRRRVFLLTGTPAFAKPKEIYTLCHSIRPDLFENFRDFGNRYCDPKPSQFYKGISYEGASNTKELHYLLTNYIMIRR